jgi:16S rRNA (guanine527-N7)-methyltransferase
MKNKLIFTEFLREHNLDENLVERFEDFLISLLEQNEIVNLVSRKTTEEEFWTKHFLDSISPLPYVDFFGKKILDFGTGGGLPGIPIKLLYPDCEMYLLDSRLKKTEAVKKIVKTLDLKQCFTIVSRIEDLGPDKTEYFDLILCRSVKITPEYTKKMFELLKKNGKIVLYKSKILDDTEHFYHKKMYEFEIPETGTRKIIVIEKK